MNKRALTTVFLLIATGLALLLCFIIALPFIRPIVSAAVMAIVFFPVHARIAKTIRNPSIAALISTFVVILVVLIPATLLGFAVANELQTAYELLKQGSTEGGGWTPYLLGLLQKPLDWIGRYVDVSGIRPEEAIKDRLKEAREPLIHFGQAAVGNLISFIVNSVIALFVLFFLFREGRKLRRRAAAILPLNPIQTEMLFNGINNAIIATVYGGLAVAFAQGLLTGIAFAVLKLPSPALWGLVTALLSLIPMIGSGAVWGPASILLIATGSWGTGLALLGCGAVISTVDNVIRPYVMSGRVKLHTLLLFFGVLGGIRAFGLLGLFIGPIALALTTALFGILRDETRAWSADLDVPGQQSDG